MLFASFYTFYFFLIYVSFLLSVYDGINMYIGLDDQ